MLPCKKQIIRWQDAFEYFKQERVDLADKTLQSYFSVLSRFFKTCEVQTCGKFHILKFLQQYHNPASYNANLFAIRSFLTWVSENYNLPNPTAKLRCKKQYLPTVRVLTETEYRKILALSGWYRDIIVFVCCTGLRNSEFCDLRPESFQGSILRVLGKGSKIREIPLNQTALSLALKYNLKINFNISKSHYVTRYDMKYFFNAISKRAKIPHLNPHAARHFFATYLIKRTNLADVSKLLGHANISTTVSRYYHPDNLSSCVNLLDL